MRFGALVEYDGGSYNGFQKQLGQPTIQGEIERAISAVTKMPIGIVGAGRTDTGVHAKGQVIAFDINWAHDDDSLLRAINSNLPRDIAIMTLYPSTARFHPRFDAIERRYAYIICNSPVRRPLRERYSWHVRDKLDLQAMNEVSKLLLGRHDFASFGSPPAGQNTVREVSKACWTKDGYLVKFEIQANAFLNRMVRSLVGSIKEVGSNSWTLSDFFDVFMARDRGRSANTAPPQGLYLMSVIYDTDV